MPEEHRRQGGKGEIHRIRPAMAGDRCGFDTSHIPIARAAVVVCIAVAHFLPEPAAWCPDTIVEAWYRGEVTYDEYQVIRQVSLAQTTDDADWGVIAVDPLEAGWVGVELIEGWLATIEPIQVFHPALQTGVRGVLTEMPIEALIMIPFTPLPELAPHKEQFFPRLGVHIAVQQPQVS